MAKRILFLGTTGVDKAQVLRNLSVWCRNQFDQQWEAIDFESSYIWTDIRQRRRVIYDNRLKFLDASLETQGDLWQDGWSKFKGDLKHNFREKNIFLAMHGCYTRPYYGIRSVLTPEQIAADFKPDLIVTLISDIYDVWWRTRRRFEEAEMDEQDRAYPSLEMLVHARRSEVLIGDQIALVCRKRKWDVRNFMLSTNHPCETLGQLIRDPHNCRVYYLSFPISQPVEARAENEQRPFNQVCQFIRDAYDRQSLNRNSVLQCPLGIDELPLVRDYRDFVSANQGLQSLSNSEVGCSSGEAAVPTARPPLPETMPFRRDERRWSLESFWPEKALLSTPPKEGKSIDINAKELEDAHGSIHADVTFRDYRMVDQADVLLVFNPLFKIDGVACLENRKEPAKSVMNEVAHAAHKAKTVLVFQDKEFDPQGLASLLGAAPVGATMAPPPVSNRIRFVDSQQELLNVIANRGKH